MPPTHAPAVRVLLGRSLAGALLLFLSAGSSAATAAAPRDQTTAAAIAGVEAVMQAAASNGFAGALIIQRGDTTLLSRGYGFANREHRVPFTPDTIAQIGSITKSQTAAAIATLIAEGKVALSDPVARFAPEAPEPGRSRTIGQLIAHRSGFADSCAEDFDHVSEKEFISRCLAIPLAHTPGENSYSNMGYSALALVVQRATGKSWEDAIRVRVWKPLHMEKIGFSFTGTDDRLFAHGYMKDVEQPVISRSIAALKGDDWALRGNGGVQASAVEMIRFLDGLLDLPGALPPEARTLLATAAPGESGEVREGFGLVFRYDSAGNLLRMAHAGSDGVFYAYLGWVPANDVRIYFVGNNGETEIKPVLRDALRAAIALPPGGPVS